MNEDRQKLWDEYTGAKPPYLQHPWLTYNRYRKADVILNSLKDREDIIKLRVLDYGCGVGDYGITFGRVGSEIYFYDLDDQINFVRFRVSKETINATFLTVGQDDPLLSDYDLVIFGEVLEHLEDPFKVLKEFIDKGTKYIYTSSYPYRSDDPNESYWKHHDHNQAQAVELQKPCRAILETNYTFTRYDGEARLWIKK